MYKRVLVIALVSVFLAYVALTNYHRFKAFEWRPGTEADPPGAKIGHSCERVHQALASKLGLSFRGMRAAPAIEVASPEEGTWSDPLGRWAGNARQVFEGRGEDGGSEIEQYRLAPESLRQSLALIPEIEDEIDLDTWEACARRIDSALSTASEARRDIRVELASLFAPNDTRS